MGHAEGREKRRWAWLVQVEVGRGERSEPNREEKREDGPGWCNPVTRKKDYTFLFSLF
jgi:hypothetical protein